MIITDVAQMIIAGPEARTGRPATGYLVHNDDPANPVWIEVTPAIVPGPGSPHCVLPPNSALAMTGAQTMWAMCAPGKTAQVHIVPSIIYGTPASGGAVGAAG
jgi:hypothetical protein